MNPAATAVDDGEQPRADRPVRTNLWFWPLALAVGFIIYELTDMPGLGAATACLKFGLEDWQTGCWLWQRDPRPERGRACGWLYLAGGLWKVAAAGVAVLFLAALVEDFGRPRIGPFPPALVGALILALVGFTLAAGATLLAFAGAAVHGLKLWLSWRIRRDRRADRWPPASWQSPGDNAAGVLILSTAFVTSVIAACAGGIALPFLPQPAALVLIAVLMLGPAAALMLFRRRGYAGLLARSPAECWSDPI